MPTVLAVVSDLHSNSTVAVCPPTVTLDDGGEYEHSKAQAWLWERWTEFWETADALKTEHDAECVTIITGELGDNNKHPTSQQVSRNPKDVMRVAEAVLEYPVLVSDRIYACRGTEAHVGMSGNLDESLARMIGAVPDSEGHHARWQFRGVIDGLRVDAAHHPGTSHGRPWTRGADANRLAQMIIDRYVWERLPVPHLIIRGHVHKPADSGDNHPSRAIILPSWQLSTSYGHRLGGDPLPIGGMLLVVEDGRIVTERKLIWRWPMAPWGNA